MARTENPHERIGREKKKLALITEIDAQFHAIGVDPMSADAHIALLDQTPEWWIEVAEQAGVHKPSYTTIGELQVFYMKRQMRAADHHRTLLNNPLAMSPTEVPSLTEAEVVDLFAHTNGKAV